MVMLDPHTTAPYLLIISFLVGCTETLNEDSEQAWAGASSYSSQIEQQCEQDYRDYLVKIYREYNSVMTLPDQEALDRFISTPHNGFGSSFPLQYSWEHQENEGLRPDSERVFEILKFYKLPPSKLRGVPWPVELADRKSLFIKKGKPWASLIKDEASGVPEYFPEHVRTDARANDVWEISDPSHVDTLRELFRRKCFAAHALPTGFEHSHLSFEGTPDQLEKESVRLARLFFILNTAETAITMSNQLDITHYNAPLVQSIETIGDMIADRSNKKLLDENMKYHFIGLRGPQVYSGSSALRPCAKSSKSSRRIGFEFRRVYDWFEPLVKVTWIVEDLSRPFKYGPGTSSTSYRLDASGPGLAQGTPWDSVSGETITKVRKRYESQPDTLKTFNKLYEFVHKVGVATKDPNYENLSLWFLFPYLEWATMPFGSEPWLTALGRSTDQFQSNLDRQYKAQSGAAETPQTAQHIVAFIGRWFSQSKLKNVL